MGGKGFVIPWTKKEKEACSFGYWACVRQHPNKTQFFFLEKKGTHGGGLLPRKGLWSVHVVLDTHGHLRVLMIRHGVLVVLVVVVVMMMVRRNCPSM